MVDKNVFTQELSKVFTILQEVRLVEKYIKELIDSNNLTEDKVVEFEEKLNQYKRDLDYINENTEQLQESLNQMNINIEDLMEYIDSIKDFINQNENTTEVGGNLEVDGNIELNSNLVVHENATIDGNITINSVNNLITKDGSSFGGGGSGEYLHLITIITGYSGKLLVIIKTDNGNNFTELTLSTWLKNNNYSSDSSSYKKVFGNVYTSNKFIITTGILSTNGKTLRFVCFEQKNEKVTINDVEYDLLLNTYINSTQTDIFQTSVSDIVIPL